MVLAFVEAILLAEATRLFGCGSGSLTWSARSKVDARSSSADAAVAAVLLVVLVATRVEGRAATRAGIVSLSDRGYT